MTLQYDQEALNLQEATPISLTTPDATSVDVILGRLPLANSSATAFITGGGSDPADVSTNNYTVTLQTTFSNFGGVINIGTPVITIVPTGVAPAFAFIADAIEDRMILRITGPVFPYTHRLKSTIVTY